MSGLVYLASPYTHSLKAIRERRADTVSEVAGKLIAMGVNVFCPIAHSHYIAEKSNMEAAAEGGKGYEHSNVHRRWMEVDLEVLKYCTKICVLMLPGWKQSKGVQEEIEFAHKLKMPVVYMDKNGEVLYEAK